MQIRGLTPKQIAEVLQRITDQHPELEQEVFFDENPEYCRAWKPYQVNLLNGTTVTILTTENRIHSMMKGVWW